MDFTKSALVVAFTLFLALTANSSSHAQDVLNACAKDVEKFCNQVTLGNGRLLACMYAHEDKISDRCDASIGEAADQLDWFLAGLRDAVEKCAGDIDKHCSAVEAGQGRIFACLTLQKDKLAPQCQGVVDNVSQRLTAK